MIIFLGNDHSNKLYKDAIEASKDDSPDIVVSCQYPYKIPESLIKSHICINIHYGVLPEYAGCYPIYRQILNGHSAGCTMHYVDKNFDAGDIIAIEEIPCDNLTADQCYEALAKEGKRLFDFHYKAILNGTAPRKPQDLTQRQYFNKNSVNFTQAKFVYDLHDRQLRALSFKGKQTPIIRVGEVDYKLEAI